MGERKIKRIRKREYEVEEVAGVKVYTPVMWKCLECGAVFVSRSACEVHILGVHGKGSMVKIYD